MASYNENGGVKDAFKDIGPYRETWDNLLISRTNALRKLWAWDPIAI